ncbi:MAG: OB-fold nucleic acid binding domain-containing protein, partial [Devosia sp.]
DAFRSLGLDRRQALWTVRGLIGIDGAETLPLFQSSGLPELRPDSTVDLPLISRGEDIIHDYRTLSFSLKAHPVSFMRKKLTERGTISAAELSRAKDGQRVEVAGLVLVRQRPGTASGIVFATLEDETGIANIVIWRKVFDTQRQVILRSKLLVVRGKLQVEGLVIHVIAENFTDMTDDLIKLANGQPLQETPTPGDETKSGPHPGRDWSTRKIDEAAERVARAGLPKGRNFH